jgi:hypothetical protein
MFDDGTGTFNWMTIKSELKNLPNGTFLVIVQSYSDKNEAITAMKSLRESDPKAGYWMSAN